MPIFLGTRSGSHAWSSTRPMATYMSFPSTSTLDKEDCCTCKGTYAPFVILPDWLLRANASYQGPVGLINGVEADMWLATTTMDNHVRCTGRRVSFRSGSYPLFSPPLSITPPPTAANALSDLWSTNTMC